MASEYGSSQRVGYRIRIGTDALRVYVPQRRDVTPFPVGADVGVVIYARQAALLCELWRGSGC